MTTDEMDGRLRSWIASRDPGPASESLRASTRSIPHEEPTPIGVRLAGTRLIGQGLIGPTRRLALVAVAVVVVAIGGIAIMSSANVGRTTVTPPPTTITSPPIPSDPFLPPLGKLQPGRYVTLAPEHAVHLTIPAGWSGNGLGIGRSSGSSRRGGVDLAVTPYDVSYVVADMCARESDVAFTSVGPGAEALTSALLDQQGVLKSGPSDVTLGGFPAKKFVLTPSPTCPAASGRGIWADSRRAYGFGLGLGETGIVYVIDVNGDRLVITADHGADASSEAIAQLGMITASIEIEGAPGARPTRRPAVAGLPIGRHPITVDGVPMSFSVPAPGPGGWGLYGEREITFDTGGSDQAEAMVYWTAFPEGSQTDRCPAQDLPVGTSIVELADAVARAPGTTLVGGPADVTLGGRPARHLVLKVRDDQGCDPKYFFSSEAPLGGHGWWTTGVGDTIRVWIVDVDGKRLFIAGESKPGLPPDVAQEIDDVVYSIQFE